MSNQNEMNSSANINDIEICIKKEKTEVSIERCDEKSKIHVDGNKLKDTFTNMLESIIEERDDYKKRLASFLIYLYKFKKLLILLEYKFILDRSRTRNQKFKIRNCQY
jgi:hypothetical protein